MQQDKELNCTQKGNQQNYTAHFPYQNPFGFFFFLSICRAIKNCVSFADSTIQGMHTLLSVRCTANASISFQSCQMNAWQLNIGESTVHAYMPHNAQVDFGGAYSVCMSNNVL